MNKIIFALLMLLSTTITFAQEKLFEKAIKCGRGPTEFYKLNNSSDKLVKLADLEEYCRKKEYLSRDVTYKNVNRFGDIVESVSTFEFLPISEFKDWQYCNLRGASTTPFSKLTSKGIMYVYNAATVSFDRREVLWSGEVVGGLVTGWGEGFYFKVEEGDVTAGYVRGSFIEGIPQGDCIVQRRNKNTYEKSTQTTLGKFCQGIASFTHDGKYGFVNTKGSVVVSPIFKKVVGDFQGGLATVVNDKDEEVLIDTLGCFKDYSDKHKAMLRQKAEEERQKAIAARQKAIEDSIAAVKHEEYRKEVRKSLKEYIENLEEGAKLVYEYKKDEGLWLLPDVVEYRIEFYVLKNKGRGRVQLQVAALYKITRRGTLIEDVGIIQYEGRPLKEGSIVWVDLYPDKEGWVDLRVPQ